MLSVLRQIFFGESEVNNIKLVAAFSSAHKEVIRLDIPVQKIPGMHIFNPKLKKYLASIWSISIRTVFRLYFRLHKLNRSSRLLPRYSIASMLKSPSVAQKYTWGIPLSNTWLSCSRYLYNLASKNNCGLRVFTASKIYCFTKL